MARDAGVTFDAFGAPRRLAGDRGRAAEPGRDDVLVRIHAAGICHHDVLSRAGRIPGRPGRTLGTRSRARSSPWGRCCGRAHGRTRGALSAPVLQQLPILPARPPRSLPREPRARRGGRRRLCRIRLRARAQCDWPARRPRHDRGRARGLPDRNERARAHWRRGDRARPDRPGHRSGRRARPASDRHRKELAGERHRGHELPPESASPAGGRRRRGHRER